MTTVDAFLEALQSPGVKSKHTVATLHNWKSRAGRGLLSAHFMVGFLLQNGYRLVQDMEWTRDGSPQRVSDADNDLTNNSQPLDSEMQDEKAQLLKKLNNLRKELNPELTEQWYASCKKQYSKGLPQHKGGLAKTAFYQMIRGKYIPKGKTLVGIEVLKEGNRILQEHREYIRGQLETL